MMQGVTIRAYGLYLSGPKEEARAVVATYLPREFEMPCGLAHYRWETIDDVPTEDTRCSCGGVEPYEHWAVKYKEAS